MAITLHALNERCRSAFENPLDSIFAFIDRSFLRHAGVPTIRLKDEHPVGVAKHRDIWIVGYEDDLSSVFHRPQRRDHSVEYESIVEVVFRLIDE